LDLVEHLDSWHQDHNGLQCLSRWPITSWYLHVWSTVTKRSH
jgi:hypothetical protein